MSSVVEAAGAQLVRTPYFTVCEQLLGEVTDVDGLMAVDGQPGTGKTTAVRTVTDASGLPVLWARLGPRPGTAKVVRQLLTLLGENTAGYAHAGEYERRLVERLSERPRILVVDEAQKLGRDGFDQLIDVHDAPGAQFTLVLLGAGVLDRLAPFPECDSRVARRVLFQPLTGATLLDTLHDYHPLLAGTDPALLRRIDARFAHGRLRRWAQFTHAAANRLDDDAAGVDEQTAAVCVAAIAGATL